MRYFPEETRETFYTFVLTYVYAHRVDIIHESIYRIRSVDEGGNTRRGARIRGTHESYTARQVVVCLLWSLYLTGEKKVVRVGYLLSEEARLGCRFARGFYLRSWFANLGIKLTRVVETQGYILDDFTKNLYNVISTLITVRKLNWQNNELIIVERKKKRKKKQKQPRSIYVQFHVGF